MYNKELISLIQNNDIALDANTTNEFSQILGEAHFYFLCKEKGVGLSRIPEERYKTPDFKVESCDTYFEVKTLSVVSGEIGIKQSLFDSLDTQIEIEEQLNEGEKVAMGETVIQPYGDKPYKKEKGPLTAVIETLIEKTRQNIKIDQYPNNKSFIVLNLSIVPPFRTENYVLKPAYCDNYLFDKAISGELWMMAFSQKGGAVLGHPEFEGKPCVEAIMEKNGVLVDPDFDQVAGILFIIHPWRRSPEIWGLYKHNKHREWCDNDPEVLTTLNKLTNINWNDEKDTNGWQLQGLKE